MFHNFFQTIFPSACTNASVSPVSSGRTGPNWFDHVKEESPYESTDLTVYDPEGNPLILGERNERASGGEGTVYEFEQNPKYLIKIYKGSTLSDSEKLSSLHDRILDMTGIQSCMKSPFLAWPCMPVLSKQRKRIGFVMRKCNGVSFLVFCGPHLIEHRFPGWDRESLVLVAWDFVKKVRFLASQGVFINDFNPANFLVNKNGEVSFIDCDSFQIPRHQGDGVHITRTFFPSHVAPELLRNKELLNEPRTIRHVEFGAALTIFNILMMGLHPYNYYDPSHQSACGTPDENLLKGRCPLGRDAQCKLPQGIWYNLWSQLSYHLKNAFIQTFRTGHSRPEERTSLEEWERNLEEMLWIIQKNPERRSLAPEAPKSKEWVKIRKEPVQKNRIV